MVFNSFQFLFFYVIITLTYWFLPHKSRWSLLLIASSYFYMAFVPKYILILGFTIVVDYIAGILIEKASDKKHKKLLLIVSLISNIGVLAIFKYYNFLKTNLGLLLSYSSKSSPFPMLKFLLPIGLSFHTFQAMSYTIEIYRGKYKAERHFGIYALYVMFYPQLVAGPIERPQNIIYQFHTKMKYNFEDMKTGLMQMAFGLFKKSVIADRIGGVVDTVYANPAHHNGKTVIIASILYSFQIYCDFSGYSDIGIGAAKTMGFTLVKNFNVPYLATSIGDFWSRWHMSLSTWFRDYLYIPLGGNRVALWRNYYNILIVFVISGLWHGASWTFIVWGTIHGLLLIFENVFKHFKKESNFQIPNNFFIRALKTLVTFTLVTLAWIFFRSPTFGTAAQIFTRIFSLSLTDVVNFGTINKASLIFSFVLIVLLLLKEKFFLIIPTKKTAYFYVIFIGLLLSSYIFGVFTNNQFIYFQF